MYIFIDGATVGSVENLVTQIQNDKLTNMLKPDAASELESLIKDIKALWH